MLLQCVLQFCNAGRKSEGFGLPAGMADRHVSRTLAADSATAAGVEPSSHAERRARGKEVRNVCFFYFKLPL